MYLIGPSSPPTSHLPHEGRSIDIFTPLDLVIKSLPRAVRSTDYGALTVKPITQALVFCSLARRKFVGQGPLCDNARPGQLSTAAFSEYVPRLVFVVRCTTGTNFTLSFHASASSDNFAPSVDRTIRAILARPLQTSRRRMTPP